MHGDNNTYNSGAKIGDKQTRTEQTGHEQEGRYQTGESHVFGSYLMRYSLLFTSNTHVHLLDPLLQRHYGGDPWRSWDTEAAP